MIDDAAADVDLTYIYKTVRQELSKVSSLKLESGQHWRSVKSYMHNLAMTMCQHVSFAA